MCNPNARPSSDEPPSAGPSSGDHATTDLPADETVASLPIVGSGYTETALREYKLYLRELLQLVAVNSLVVDTAAVAFENEITLPKHRQPVRVVVHNCVDCSFVCLLGLIAYLF